MGQMLTAMAVTSEDRATKSGFEKLGRRDRSPAKTTPAMKTDGVPTEVRTVMLLQSKTSA